jgi:mono/diheme cytochrome c family protein
MTTKTAARLALAAGGALLAAATAAQAQGALVEQGRSIAQTWCVSCHAIGSGEQSSALVGAPSFRSLGLSENYDEEALAAALLRPHPVMPEMPLTRQDLRAIAAYLDWLAEEERSAAPTPEAIVTLAGSQTVPAAVERGRAIVAGACADCHAIAGPGPSPVADAPAFSTLSQNYPVAHLEEALAEGILVGHPEVEMPEFVFEPDEIGAIIAYLESVQAD